MSQTLCLQPRPRVDKRRNRVVADQKKNCFAGRECVVRLGGCASTRPAKNGNIEEAEVVLEMTGDAAVANDSDRGRAVRRYLSHGSGPPSKRSPVRLVAVLS